MNIDNKIHQLVLHVKEPKRKFFAEVGIRDLDSIRKKFVEINSENIKKHFSTRRKVTFYEKNGIWGEDQETSDRSMLYLMGLDERQLFIARLPKAITTVAEAHKSLKATEVITAEGKALGKTIRQGEWFFINATQEEIDEINKLVKQNIVVIKKKYPIGHRGIQVNSHVADEGVNMPPARLSHGFSVRDREEIFVRGAVRHRDHETIKLGNWRKVIRNTEPQSEGFNRSNGMTWVD
jgi:hypothetical protein